MAYTAEQRRIIRRIRVIAREVGASPKQVKAAFETGRVESNFTNSARMTDHDSQGWRQERASLYPDPTNLDASIRRFFRETAAVKGRYGRAGDLAAAVQRPAAQYRGRYQAVSGEAQRLLDGMGLTEPTVATRRSGAGDSGTRTATTTTPGVDNSAARGQLVSQFLGTHGKPDVLGFAAGIKALRDTPGTTRTTSSRSAATATAPERRPGGSLTARAEDRANAIDRKRLPYLWGGGHGGKVNPYKATPLDCSGAVSAVLGINPRVASQFKTFGSPGRGDGKGIVIYAKDTHVLMEIDGHFWGTSGSNPGGGAGWIKRSQIAPSYLRGFTVRHLARS